MAATPMTMWTKASAAGKQPLTNWAGNLTYSTDRVTDAASLEQVRAFVKANERLKAQGTRHCFNNIADSKDNLLAMKPLHEVVSMDTAARTVTVDAGISYGQLSPYLEGKGWALHNLASLPHISVAGAAMTGTHGSGEKNGNLATAVVGLEMVNGAGDVVSLSKAKDGEAFRAAVVGVGALGVVTKVTLAIQPRFAVKQWVYENMPMADMAKHFDQIQAAGYSVSLFTDWKQQRINEVWVKCRVGTGYPMLTGQKEFFGGHLATKNLHPIAEISAENCTEQMGVPGPWFDRLPHFKMGFTPSAGKELQSEYFVPRSQAVDAIMAVEKLHEKVSPLLLVSEIRTIAADDLWLSMAYQRPSVALHFTWKPDWENVQKVLPLIEKELGPFGYRPHWGKLFTMSGEELRGRYERMPEFVAMAKKFDPHGKFRNDFLKRNVFGD